MVLDNRPVQIAQQMIHNAKESKRHGTARVKLQNPEIRRPGIFVSPAVMSVNLEDFPLA